MAAKRKPRKKGQHTGSPNHSDLYTNEREEGTIRGLGFKDAATARKGVATVNKAKRTHAHKVQATLVMQQRAKVAKERAKDPEKKKNLNSAYKIWSDHLEKLKKKTAKKNEGLVRQYVRSMLEFSIKANKKNVHQDGTSKSRGYMSGVDKTWTGEDTNSELHNWYKKMGLMEISSMKVTKKRLRKIIRERLKKFSSEDFKDVYNTARMAHVGQTRRDGSEYFSHPSEVRNIARSFYPQDNVVQMAALLHDSLEDAPGLTMSSTEEMEDFIRGSIQDQSSADEVIRVVRALTHEKGGSYTDYVLGLLGDIPTLRVKLADMVHNLTDAPSPKQKAKYKTALDAISSQTGGRAPGGISSSHWEKLLSLTEGRRLTESQLRKVIRKEILIEEAQDLAMSKVASYLSSEKFDDVMDAVFKKVAPGLVRHVITNEINEDVEEFRTGAIEGRFEKRADFAGQDPSPDEMQIDSDSLDYQMGYKWGWENSDTWKGNDLPPAARKEAVESQISEFEDQISEQMVIAALETANEKVNPVKLLGTAKDAIAQAVREDGLIGGLKKGLPIAIGIIVGEALDNVIIPIAFHSMTGIPIPPLPIGVGDVMNPIIISMVGGSESELDPELPDAYSDYESSYGRPESIPPGDGASRKDELKAYIRELIYEIGAPVPHNQWTMLAAGDPRRELVKQNLFDLVQQTYEPIGGHFKISSPDSLNRYTYWVVKDIDEDPDIDVAIMGKPDIGGVKMGAAANDGSGQAASEYKNKSAELRAGGSVDGVGNWWGEVSGKPAYAMISRGAKAVEDEAKARQLLDGDDIEWHGEYPLPQPALFKTVNGWYTKRFGDKSSTKIILGNPS